MSEAPNSMNNRINSSDPSAPLAGITVVELGASVAGPFAGQTLGDLGAEVIKIEKPDGDDARQWGPPFVDGAAALFQALNRNKRSVVCDLRDGATIARLTEFIVTHADVVVQNMRPGQVDELQLGAAALRAKKPALIYCNMGAFGRVGPLAKRPGYDPLMQAFGGVMSTTGEAGRAPVRVGPSMMDMGTAMWAVIGIVSALYRRRATGEGAVIDVSLFETAATWMNMYSAQFLASGILPGRNGSGQTGLAPYRAFATTDGDVVIAAGSDALYRKLCIALAHPEWIDDARFASNPARVANVQALNALIDALIRTQSSAHWIDVLDRAGVPCAPIQNVKQLLEHEQLHGLGMLQAVPGASIPFMGLPVSFDGQRATPRSASPALGADTETILSRSTP